MARFTENRNYPTPDETAEPPESGTQAFLILQSALDALDIDIQDILLALALKSAVDHNHGISDVEGLTVALAAKMAVDKKFKLDDLTDVDGADSSPIGYVLVKTADGWIAQSALAAVGAHEHSIAQIVGLAESLDLKQGVSGKGTANGYAALDGDGKVPTAQLPSLTTTATVGAALAGASQNTTLADGDRFSGVLSGASTVFWTTWGNIKSALTALFVTKTGNSTVSGTITATALNATGDVKAGAHTFQSANANILGGANSIWANWGALDAYSAINARIEARAAAHAAGAINAAVTSSRMAGAVDVPKTLNSSGPVVTENSAYVCTGVQVSGGVLTLRFRQPQLHIPNVGWFAAFPF